MTSSVLFAKNQKKTSDQNEKPTELSEMFGWRLKDTQKPKGFNMSPETFQMLKNDFIWTVEQQEVNAANGHKYTQVGTK